MIDEDTRRRFHAVQLRALQDGIPLIDALKAARLLRDEETIKYDWANCLERLWLNIESQPIVALTTMGGGQNTPLDAIRGALEYIDIFRKTFAAQAGETQ